MTINELYEKMIRVYDSNSISLENTSLIEIEENQNQNRDKFEKLNVRCSNPCIVIKDSLLKNSNNSFSANKQLKLNKECDKILITEKEGRKVVLLFEIKSSFSSGLESGLPQLRASCFKIHLFLNSIDAFLYDDFEFRAVLASWKPTTEQVTSIIKENNIGEITDRKKLMIEVYREDIVCSTIDRSRTGIFYSLPLKSEYIYDVPLFLFTTDFANPTADLELSRIV